MHGFNRLGGNSVAETVVAGMIVGEFIADFCDKPENEVDIPTGAGARVPARPSRRSSTRCSTAAAPRTPTRSRQRMQEIMTDEGRHLPHAARTCEAAVDELQQLLVQQPQHRPALQGRAAPNPELVTAYRVQKMLKLALCVAYGALDAHREPRRALPRRTSRAATTPSG